MPTYVFKCEDCGRESEQLVRNKAAASKVTCAHCGSKKVKRIIAAGSMLTKMADKSSASASSCPTCCSGGSCGL